MSKPTVTQTIGGYVFSWDEGIQISVSRLRVHNSDGRVTGEVLIKNQKLTLYPQTQINFSADMTRNRLTKALTERYADHQWQGIIDQLCYIVQEKAREGEPVIDLWTHEEIKPPSYLVYPIIISNQPNVLFGPPESGKTQFALLLSVIMMLPWSDNPLGLTAPNKPIKPLWLDYEADRDTTQWNFTRIAKGADVGELFLPYRRCRMPLADDIEQIANHVDRIKANCVIIDSLAKATGGDLDKSESPTRFFQALDQLKCTSIILAHTSKGIGEGRKTIYGSTFFEAYARSVWEMRASPDGDTLHIGLWDNKANFRGKVEPMAFSLNYEGDAIRVTTEDIKTVEDFMQHLSVSAMILENLKGGSKSPKELKELMPDVASGTFYAELARLTKKKKLVKIHQGNEVHYGLYHSENS